MSWWVFLVLAPIGLATFIISFLIGHFLSEPLRMLTKKTAAYRAGRNVQFTTDGRLSEADQLSADFDALVQTVVKQQRELELKEKRQSEFVSDVAHELKTPLTAIRGNAEMLTDPELPPALHDKFCTIIQEESERLSRLTHDLLALQRIEQEADPVRFSRVNLRSIAMSVLDALSPLLQKHHANVQVIGEAPDVFGNPDKLKEAITNLVDNANRFIDDGGHITIELFGLRERSVIMVKDDGPGFGDVDPQLLFDRFYRTDFSRSRDTGGTGLGLAIVKTIVEAHDGAVEAYNSPSGGACFVIMLPALPA
ncbi:MULTISPECIES: sensor histidine kinase [unclassified Adlercreutzia]|uniref:sensor histidine kinase n=1 Tax=unclassified Adlercreutzia TaxID=2636013 RepID=UPI001F156080|nr:MULTISPECIES: HAMP domain-containing sensor histidine kinase [unclassified Adlercreutzia]